MQETKIPKFLIEMLKNQYGQDLADEIVQGYKEKRDVTLRVNTLKSNISEIKMKLERTQYWLIIKGNVSK